MLKPAPDALPQQPGLQRYFLLQQYCFAAIGINPTSLSNTVFNKYLIWIPTMSVFTLCFPITIYASQYIQDLNLVTDALAPLWQCILVIMKLCCFMWNQKKVVKLIRKIWLRNFKARDEELKVILEENRNQIRHATFFFYSVLATGISALISPLVIAYYYYLKGYGFWKYLEPPLKAAYFVDPKTYPGYILAFSWNSLAVYYVVNGSISVDTLFTWFSHNISAQFRIVNLRFKLLADNVQFSKCDEDELLKSIILSIKYHRDVIELADAFNEVYMVTIFIKFIISFLQIAFIAFQISRGGEFSAMVFHILFLAAASFQLSLYCYGGQRIIDESSAVSVAIYDCFEWHNLSIRSKKLLLLPLMRSQKPCILTGFFFVANLPLFLWVFKTAGSIITMLMALEVKVVN